MNTDHESIVMKLVTDTLDQTQKSQLLEQIKDDAEAMALYHQLKQVDEYVLETPLHSPSAQFTSGVLAGYDREVVSKRNNKLLGYFVAIAAAIVLLMLIFIPEATISTKELGVAKQFNQQVNALSQYILQDNFIQLILIANLMAFIVVIDKIINKRKMFNLYTFLLG